MRPMPHSSQNRTFYRSSDSATAIAAATRTTLTGWGVQASQVALVAARVRTLTMLLTACSATELHLHVFHADGRIQGEITTPAMVLHHQLPAWQVRPSKEYTRYATHVDVQVQSADDGEPGLALEHSLRVITAIDTRRSA